MKWTFASNDPAIKPVTVEAGNELEARAKAFAAIYGGKVELGKGWGLKQVPQSVTQG